MPLPLLLGLPALAEFIAVWWARTRIFSFMSKIAASVGAGTIAGEFVKSAMNSAIDELKAEAWKHRWSLIAGALEKLTDIKLELDEQGNPTQESITAAINAKLGTEFSNVFDREAIKSDLEKIALIRINENLGFSKDNLLITSLRDKDVIRAQIHGFVGKQAQQIIDGQSAPFLAPDAPQRIASAAMHSIGKYERYIPEEKQAVSMDEKSIKNRERQARYRARHKREWRQI